MPSVTYGLYLSTNSNTKSLQPYDKTNLNNVKWNINWKEIFGSKEGECRVRVKLVSQSATNFTWSANTGSLRASFASNYQNSTNGFNLGSIEPKLVSTIATPITTYLECNTIDSKGVTMIIPKTNNNITISILNANETLMASVVDYQIWLYFDVEI